MAKSDIVSLIESNRIIICCGSGGVGKTTISAALAIKAACLGKRAVVITIDPAKRLATSLGLEALSSTPTDLSERLASALKANNLPALRGKLFAVMPDTAQTFEKFVRSMAGKDEALAHRVLKNSIYKIFAKEFSGANEYMAMEKLHQIATEEAFDLIVLDTPPSANTSAFLEAPDTLAVFFDDRIIKWFIKPGSKLVAAGLKMALEILEKLTGHGFISELIEFATALFELRTQFMINLKTVSDLLHQKEVSFLMVTSPERLSKNDTLEFVSNLSPRGLRFWGFIINRVLSRRIGIENVEKIDLTALGKTVDAADASILLKNFGLLHPALEHEKDATRYLRSISRKNSSVIFVPEQQQDVHSIDSLLNVSQGLS